jgi:sortase A
VGRRLTRPLGRRFTSALAWVLLAAGGLLLLDAGLTLVWQEPVTAVLALVRQHSIDRRYLAATRLVAVDRRTLGSLSTRKGRGSWALSTPEGQIAYLAGQEKRVVPHGAAMGRIVIRRLGLSSLVVQGADQSSLQLGPGHYASTAFPGQGRTVAIAGHRTTWLAPFRNLDELAPGDRIVLDMPYGTFTYAVQYQRVVSPGAWWITRNVGYERLVLSACTPLFSAAQRIVVFARLISEQSAQPLLGA